MHIYTAPTDTHILGKASGAAFSMLLMLPLVRMYFSRISMRAFEIKLKNIKELIRPGARLSNGFKYKYEFISEELILNVIQITHGI